MSANDFVLIIFKDILYKLKHKCGKKTLLHQFVNSLI
jgi:hypothetical protein